MTYRLHTPVPVLDNITSRLASASSLQHPDVIMIAEQARQFDLSDDQCASMVAEAYSKPTLANNNMPALFMADNSKRLDCAAINRPYQAPTQTDNHSILNIEVTWEIVGELLAKRNRVALVRGKDVAL